MLAAEAEEYLKQITPYPIHRFKGRGIVICGGGIKYGTCAWVLIRLLRHLGCNLQIELWHLGQRECPPEFKTLVEVHGVRTVNAFRVRDLYPHPRLKGWPLKPYSILHSKFREVLFLDADIVPVRDPTFLFVTEQFKKAGHIFWPEPEHFQTAHNSLAWRVFGVPPQPGPDQESGQILIDKSRCWNEISLCNWYNENSHFFYKYIYGDKDTFRFAWQKLRREIEWVPSFPGLDIPFTAVQNDFDGQPLFQHRYFQKWSLYGENATHPAFAHAARCISFVRELRSKWSPIDTLYSAKEQERTSAVLNGQTFELVRVGFNKRKISFGPKGIIKGGQTKETFHWWTRMGALVLANEYGVPTSVFRRTGSNWTGRSLSDSRVKLMLVETN